METLCFGGSFNPIHFGHLRTSQAVATRLGYKQILLIPSAKPPHKPDTADLASPGHRLAMCQLAIQGQPLFATSDIEIKRTGPSYTLDTARELRAMGWKSVHWLIGADMLRILPSWHRAQELIREVNFVIMARPVWNFDWESLPTEFQALKANVVEAPLIDISATEIRRRMRSGESIDELVPAPVAAYIRQHGLYR